MTRGRIALLLVGVALVSGGVIAANVLRKPHLRVDILANHSPVARSAPGSATSAPLATAASREARWSDPAAPAKADPTPDPIPPPLFDGNALIGRLKAHGTLTDARRKELESVLSVIAAAQNDIDRFPDPAERARLQANLLHQLTVRLRLVLGDEESKPIAALLGQQHPHVVFQKEN